MPRLTIQPFGDPSKNYAAIFYSQRVKDGFAPLACTIVAYGSNYAELRAAIGRVRNVHPNGISAQPDIITDREGRLRHAMYEQVTGDATLDVYHQVGAELIGKRTFVDIHLPQLFTSPHSAQQELPFYVRI